LSNMLSELTDTWAMETELFGKIENRCPKGLATYHNVLCRQLDLLGAQINDEKLAEYYSEKSSFEWENDEYVVKAPKSVKDMLDEAAQQSNCLRSHIRKVAEGEEDIFFLRRKAARDKSLVTVRVKGDSVVEIKARFNERPSSEHETAVKAWAKAKNLICAY